MNRRIASIGFSIAMGASVSLAQAADTASKDDQLEEVVVTGVLQNTKILEAPIAIATVTSEEIAKQVPISAADLLKNVPGVFVNSSLGEIRNVVFSRGVAANSLDAAAGYYYVSLQEDGLPVTNATFTNYGPDYLYRPDITLGRLEALRGGTASLTGPNAPGGIFNYISRDGAKNPGTEVRARYGLEGDFKNPFYRVDLYNGGSFGSGWSYSVGGFYRKAVGSRDPGYDMNKGGQLKANLKYDYGNGAVQVYGKFLDDHNGWFEFLPAKNYDNPTLVQGISSGYSFLPPSNPHTFSYDGGASTETWDGSKLVESEGRSIGVKWDHDFGGGWSLANNVKYSSNRTDWNTGAVIFPLSLTDPFTYILAGALGPGTYTFKQHGTNNVLANVTASLNFAKPIPFDFTVNANNLPNQQVLANGVLSQAALVAHNALSELMDQFSVTKKTDTMAFTLGGFYARSSVSTHGAGGGLGISPIENKPMVMDITFAPQFAPPGTVQQVTDAAGFGGKDGMAFGGPSYATQTQASLFFGHNWKLTPDWTLDWGARYEHLQVSGGNSPGGLPFTGAGGLDGNPDTLYDNSATSGAAPYLPYSKSVGFTNYTASLLRKLGENQSAYVRYSDGKKAPDLGYFQGLSTQYLIDTGTPLPQHIQQLEAGYRHIGSALSVSVSPFYSKLSDVGSGSVFTDTTGTVYTRPALYSTSETLGVEFDGSYVVSRYFDVHTAITVQNPQSKDFRTWLHPGTTPVPGDNTTGANDPRGDVVAATPDGLADNNPRLMANTSFNFGFTEQWSGTLAWQYMGSRAANRYRTFYLPDFNQFNLSLRYEPTARLSFSVNVNNLLNGKGIMSWAAAGGFFAALDRQGFSPAQRAANPDATFSVVTIQPRAGYLTVAYRFD